MARSFDTFTGDGIKTAYDLSFPYILKAHVLVKLDGVLQTLTTDYTWTTDSQITFVTVPASAVRILLARETSPSTRLVNYVLPDALAEATLDEDSLQAFYLAQEGLDLAENAIVLDVTDDEYDATSKVIKSVADGANANDAINKGQLDAIVAAAGAVPTATDPGDDGKLLVASGGAWSWTAFLVARISDTVAFMKTFLTSANVATARSNLGLVIGTDVLPEITLVTQAAAEAGTATAEKIWTAQRVAQAITAQALGKVLQSKHSEIITAVTATTVIPDDTSKPESDEGDQVDTLAITPAATGNRLLIFVSYNGSVTTGQYSGVALFQDSVVLALAGGQIYNDANNTPGSVHFVHEMGAGTTSETTFKVRVGPSVAATVTLNGVSGALDWGGSQKCTIDILEIEV